MKFICFLLFTFFISSCGKKPNRSEQHRLPGGIAVLWWLFDIPLQEITSDNTRKMSCQNSVGPVKLVFRLFSSDLLLLLELLLRPFSEKDSQNNAVKQTRF